MYCTDHDHVGKINGKDKIQRTASKQSTLLVGVRSCGCTFVHIKPRILWKVTMKYENRTYLTFTRKHCRRIFHSYINTPMATLHFSRLISKVWLSKPTWQNTENLTLLIVFWICTIWEMWRKHEPVEQTATPYGWFIWQTEIRSLGSTFKTPHAVWLTACLTSLVSLQQHNYIHTRTAGLKNGWFHTQHNTVLFPAVHVIIQGGKVPKLIPCSDHVILHLLMLHACSRFVTEKRLKKETEGILSASSTVQVPSFPNQMWMGSESCCKNPQPPTANPEKNNLTPKNKFGFKPHGNCFASQPDRENWMCSPSSGTLFCSSS